MLKKFMFSAVFICFLSGFSFAGAELVGTTSENFSKIPPFARAAAMGEAFTAVSDGTYGLYYNPAGMTLISGYEAQLTHIAWFQDINYEFLSLVAPFPMMDFGKIGLALAWFRVDELTKTSALASYDPAYLDTVDYSQFTEKFSPFDLSVTLAYALDLKENFSAGASLKYTSQFIDKFNGSNITAEIGFLYRVISYGNYLRLGIDMTNLGSDLKLHDIGFEPPKLLKVGLSDQLQIWNGTMLIAAQAVLPADYAPVYSIGFEYWLFDMVALRFGYKTGGFDHPTFGAGFRYNNFEIDYAYIRYDELGNTHRFSLLYSWGSPAVKLKVTPALFSPNKDNFLDTVSFIPVLKNPEKLKALKLSIFGGDKETALASFNLQDKAAKSVPWGGNTKAGVLPDAVYQASITAEYDNGTSESNRVSVEIDNTPPVTKVDGDPKLLKPGQKDSLIIPATFTFFAQDRNKVSKWQFVIWDYDKKVFYSTQGSGEPPLSIIWDGKSNDGSYVKTGEVYHYSLIAYDTVGNRGQTAIQSVVVLLKEIKLTFASDALFDLGEADVKISAYSVLKDMKKTIDAHPDSEIVVAGYTDNIQPRGIKYKDNTELSKARADAVKFFMVNLLEYDEKRIKTEGYGELMPIADNNTEEGRLKNRRVDIIIRSTIYK